MVPVPTDRQLPVTPVERSPTNATPEVLRLLGPFWGTSGLVALLAWAIVRLFPVAAEAVSSSSMAPAHWLLLLAWSAGMLWAEGYRGFHMAFAPRVASRALHLLHHPRPLLVVLAPIYLMGYVHATPERRWRAMGVTAAIVVLVVLVRFLAQPWRGIVDAGVVLGLGVGIASILWHTARALRKGTAHADPEVPALHA
jgi:hypothetical protein